MISHAGEVPKRLKGLVSKTDSGRKSSEGSNPSFSAKIAKQSQEIGIFFLKNIGLILEYTRKLVTSQYIKEALVMFIGREKELKQLNSAFASGKKELGVIYGRRRIGKTKLIDHFVKDKPHLFYQAKEDSSYGNLRSFSYELNKLMSLPLDFVYSSWQAALDALSGYFKDTRFVLCIDEYPFITKQDKSFSSTIEEYFDHSDEKLMLLISGSDVSFLKEEIRNEKSPLYKRKTFEMNVQKLPLEEALKFFNGVNKETACSFLSLMSTFPYYLSAINTNNTFENEIKRLVINEYGPFFNLPENVLSKSTKPDIYNAILFAIANRRTSISDISSFIKEETGKVSKYLTTLLESEVVGKRTTFNGNKNNNYYVITDPLLKFWYKAVYPNQSRIVINPDMIFDEISADLKQAVEFGFEDVSLLYLNKLNRTGKLGRVYPEIRTFKADNTKLGRSVEIDGLAEQDGHLLVVECKYRKEKFTLEMFEHLKESDSIFNKKLTREYYLFSKSGFDEKIKETTNVKLIDLNILFSN